MKKKINIKVNDEILNEEGDDDFDDEKIAEEIE